MKKTLMKKYAALIARVGANVQKGQTVEIHADVDQGEFISMLVEACYKAGASRVDCEWTCQPITKLNYRYRTLRSLSEVPAWKEEKMKLAVEEVPCRIYIDSEDPDGLRGIDQEKMQKARMRTYPIIRKYRDALENKEQWTIAAVPSAAWAKKVFPGEQKNRAVERLWEAILKTVRVTEDNDPVAAWKAHDEAFRARCAWLNAQHFDSLHYRSANGTDFRVGLIPEGRFCGGGETSLLGHFFNPNMPTEEIFVSPKRGAAEGRLVSTMPLSWQGQLIEDFAFDFKDGRAVSWEAKKGKELLDRMLGMDEGAPYLGEVALVPKDSPISESGILFYNTLFDENASCHVAFGRGYMDTIDGYADRTQEECHALGVNDSMIHVDFMIGAPDLSITGYKDGKATPVFTDGTWAEGIPG